MAIAGPKIQMPASLSQMFDVQKDKDGITSISVKPDWASFFHSLQQTVFLLTRSGPTASRPGSQMDGRYIGMTYFDTSLGGNGTLISLASVTPDVWVDGTGAVV